MVMCLDQGADLHIAQLMPLPLTVTCSSKSRLVLLSWFYLSGTGSPGSPGHSPGGCKTVVVVNDFAIMSVSSLETVGTTASYARLTHTFAFCWTVKSVKAFWLGNILVGSSLTLSLHSSQ